MALGKYTRVDNSRRSSSYCSTVTIVVFVALCLVGVWMLTSSTVAPGDVPAADTKSEVKKRVPQTDSKPFEDSSGDVPDEAKGGDTDTGGNGASDESSEEKKPQGENSGMRNGDVQDESDGMQKDGTFNDSNGKTGGADATKDDGEAGAENGEANTDGIEDGETKKVQDSDETGSDEETKNGEEQQQQSGETKKSEQDEKTDGDSVNANKDEDQVGQNEGTRSQQSPDEKKNKKESKDQGTNEMFPDGAQSELLNETNTQNGAWSTQAAESKNEKEAQASSGGKYIWKLCQVNAGADYIPCLDNEKAIKQLPSTKHYEHRERHCPEEAPTCLVPLPDGYQKPIEWPQSRDRIRYSNVPHTKLAEVKGHQNWVKVSGDYLTFPGGGTQFKHGALHYIDFIQETLPAIAWGKRSRVILDVGCGVASFGGYLFDRDVLTMSFAPKDEHEAQVQFALERGIPAISAVMGTKRLPYPAGVFDIVHCARCRVPWHIEGGVLLLELNRLLRPGGYFVWSATPVYQNRTDDVQIWEAMSALTKSMCWEMVAKTKDSVNQVGLAIFRKPSNNDCYFQRSENNPPICGESDGPDAAWNIPLQACMHKVPVDPSLRGSQWPDEWPLRLEKTPYWINSSQVGVYGKRAPEDFQSDYKHWKRVVSKSYLNGMGINWSTVRNVMDMRAVYGGFAAALRDMKVWVVNIISIDSPDTLPIIFERGLFGMYHNWCEPFSTYPRTYDLLHADHLFSKLKKRCKLLGVIAEVDRILRPEGKLIVRDNVETISELENLAKSLHWEIRLTYSKENEGLLCVEKTMWRPSEAEAST